MLHTYVIGLCIPPLLENCGIISLVFIFWDLSYQYTVSFEPRMLESCCYLNYVRIQSYVYFYVIHYSEKTLLF